MSKDVPDAGRSLAGQLLRSLLDPEPNTQWLNSDPRLRVSADLYEETDYFARLRPGEYAKALQLTWDHFVSQLREGRYLDLKGVERALRGRQQKLNDRINSRGYATLIDWRLRVLDTVLFEFEVYGCSEFFDRSSANMDMLIRTDEDARLAVRLSNVKLRYTYIVDVLRTETKTWNDAFVRYEAECDRLGVTCAYGSPESMKSAVNKWQRDGGP